MENLLFAAYLVLFAWLVTAVRFFRGSGLSNPQLVILLLLKVMTGIFYGWMGIYYGETAQMLDTWAHHRNGLLEYDILKTNPHEYFTNLFRDPYHGSGVDSFFGSADSYWNDLKGNVFAKILSIFDIFSFGNYYINVIFYSFLTLFGPIAIYRVMIDVFPRQKIAVMIGSFLLPSFLYWSSGIHKEGAIALGIGLVVYHFYFGLRDNRWGVGRVLTIGLGLLLLLTLRNFVLVILLPALFAWWLAHRKPKRALAVFLIFYGVCMVLFFTMRYVDARLDFPQAVVDKQAAFLALKGNTSIETSVLQPNAWSFIINIPQAVFLSAARPLPTDANHILSMAAAAEIACMWLLVFLLIAFPLKGIRMNSFLWFVLFFSVTLLLAIGFSVNNLGAIVRYRSILFPLMITPILAGIDWSRLNEWVGKNIKK